MTRALLDAPGPDLPRGARRAAVGSSNFDDRSFETNDELTLGILDPDLAVQLDAIFEKYVARAEEVELEDWHRRGAWHKLKDNVFYLFHELL